MSRIDAPIDATRHYVTGDFSARVAEYDVLRDGLSLLEHIFNGTRAAIQYRDATVHRLIERFQRVVHVANDWTFNRDTVADES